MHALIVVVVIAFLLFAPAALIGRALLRSVTVAVALLLLLFACAEIHGLLQHTTPAAIVIPRSN
jgi:hypothetical protein